jgi:hypothetical protein
VVVAGVVAAELVAGVAGECEIIVVVTGVAVELHDAGVELELIVVSSLIDHHALVRWQVDDEVAVV